MFNNRSPPNYNKNLTGGSNDTQSKVIANTTSNATANVSSASASSSSSSSLSSPMQLGGGGIASRTSSALSLQSSASQASLLLSNVKSFNNHSHHNHYHHSHAHHHQHQHQHQHQYQPSQHHHSSRTSLTPPSKRGKKNWGSRERSGMSFLIVIAFFAVFGLIILTEVFMIDERSHSGMLTLRQGSNLGGRLGDSMPDYDNVKDDYDLLGDSLLSDNKLGFVQFRDNKLKIQEAAGDAGRYAGVLLNNGAGGYGGGGGLGGANVPIIPWGQVLPAKVEETLPHFPFGTRPTDGSWQVVNGTRFKFFVFSAYYDRRDGARLVRVVGATKTRGPERVWCRFWYEQRNATALNEGHRAKYTSATVMARVKIIRENWNLKYSACFVLCPVVAAPLEMPLYVSVVSRLRAPPGNLLQLRNTDWDADFAPRNASGRPAPHAPPTGDNIGQQLAVCVKPFHFSYDQALYLMEYLEFYALLGISHFTFYNHTMGPHTSCVLKHYIAGDIPANLTAIDFEELRPGAALSTQTQSTANASRDSQRVLRSAKYVKPTVTILPWDLRMRSQKEIRTEGLFAALNDCLYRTMYRYKYLALVDLDEFIVPRYTDTLSELLSSLNRRFRNRNTGAYSFQNAFFYLQFADDPLASALNAEKNEELTRLRAALVTQRKTRRRYKLHPQKQRSKYICKPEAVVEAGNHFVWEFAPGKGSLNVPPKEAILQHYRVCEFGGNDCIKAPSIVDRTTTKYVNRLVQRVDAVYKYLRQRCDLPPLPVLLKPQPRNDDNRLNRKPIFNNKSNNDNDKNNNNKNNNNNNNNNEKNKLLRQEQEQENETKVVKAKVQKNGTTRAADAASALTRATTTKTTTTTTRTKTTRTRTTTKGVMANGTSGNGNAKPEEVATRVRKKRKFVVFEHNEYGVPVARVEYQ